MEPLSSSPVEQNVERVEPVRVKLSQNGQVSIPASVRRRWGTKDVVVIDKGDRLILRPALSLDELAGRYAGRQGPSTDEIRAAARAEDAEREARSW